MDKIFNENKDLKSYYKTSDGHAFYKEDTAKLHAKTLEDKRVELVERKEDLKGSTDSVEKPLKKMNHQELKDKASSLSIEFTDESKADLIILIEAKLSEIEENSNEDNKADTNENKED